MIRPRRHTRSIVLSLWLAAALPALAAPEAPDAPMPVETVAGGPADAAPPVDADVAAIPLVRQVGDRAAELVVSAMQFIGVPYRRGGASAERGFDCSGFTRHVFEHSLGLVLPRRADEQARRAGLPPVQRDDLEPGDLVFFNTMRRAFSHVGIYVGDGKFLHAPRSGAEVRIEDMRGSYWSRRFNGARRALQPGPDERQSP